MLILLHSITEIIILIRFLVFFNRKINYSKSSLNKSIYKLYVTTLTTLIAQRDSNENIQL